ncbi:MAG: chromosomal replication initiator protein DnaA [Candidatus Desulfofervidaceae bacterium]|nr:chromosomal replication initiator protein DnaA [Candidatus Desulfofervidaceae bacterium]
MQKAGVSQQHIWQKVQTHLSEALPPNLFDVWVKPLRLLAIEDGKIIIGCPNRFFLEWIKEHFLHYLKEACMLYLPECREILLKIIATEKKNKKTPRQIIQPPLPLALPRPRLCKAFTFEEFVVGECNQYAYTTACNLANGHFEQPVFFYSDTGLGKSHLSQAVGNYILTQKKEERIFYITAEEFTNEMVRALKSNYINDFKEKYRRECDVLILENIHFLSGKEKIQTELAYTLDALWESRKRVIFTSLTPPQKTPAFKKELKSRIESSLIVPINPPDLDTRFKILKKKAIKHKQAVPENILQYLACYVKGDVRRLESALNNVLARATLQKRPLDLDLAKEVALVFIENQPQVDLNKIKTVVCHHYKLHPEDLLAKSRARRVCLPRKIAIYLARRYLNLSLAELGKKFQRHHATVLSALNAVEQEMKKSSYLAREVEYLCKKIEES